VSHIFASRIYLTFGINRSIERELIETQIERVTKVLKTKRRHFLQISKIIEPISKSSPIEKKTSGKKEHCLFKLTNILLD
jgi:hypothetical protein